MSKKSDGSQVKESTDSSATMDEEDGKGDNFINWSIFQSRENIFAHDCIVVCIFLFFFFIFTSERYIKKLDLLIDDKKGGVDRSTTVIAKEPEGIKPLNICSLFEE